eukprot:1537287-Prymnesium_polylepis.1
MSKDKTIAGRVGASGADVQFGPPVAVHALGPSLSAAGRCGGASAHRRPTAYRHTARMCVPAQSIVRA